MRSVLEVVVVVGRLGARRPTARPASAPGRTEACGGAGAGRLGEWRR